MRGGVGEGGRGLGGGGGGVREGGDGGTQDGGRGWGSGVSRRAFPKELGTDRLSADEDVLCKAITPRHSQVFRGISQLFLESC